MSNVGRMELLDYMKVNLLISQRETYYVIAMIMSYRNSEKMWTIKPAIESKKSELQTQEINLSEKLTQAILPMHCILIKSILHRFI